MRATRLFILLVVAMFGVSASGCAGKRQKKQQDEPAAQGTETTKGPTPLTEAEKKIQADAMALMEKVAEAADKHKDDCDALVAAWTKLWDENTELVAKAVKIDSDPKKVAEWESLHKERKQAIETKLEPVLAKCAKHDGMKKLLAKMRPEVKAKK